MLGGFCKILGFVLMALIGSQVSAAPQVLRINSVTFSAPAPLKAGDIITVDLAGTPDVRAAFSVKSLIPATRLKEVSPGSYHGTVQVPAGKIVRNAPLVGYLGNDTAHAAPVQAGRLVTVVESRVVEEPSKLPVVRPEPRTKPADPPPAAKPVVPDPPKPAPPPAPVAAVDKGKIVLTSPVDGATLKHAILVKGKARPGSVVRVVITYNNSLSGMMKLAGNVASQNLAVDKSGEFRMGPIALDGPLATDGLRFTIKAYYPDRADHGTADVTVIGRRD